MDQRIIAFVAKRTPDDGPPQLVSHVLLPDDRAELASLYHNRLPQDVADVAPEFLFARLAWAILTDEALPFFGNPFGIYKVSVFDKDTCQVKEESIQGTPPNTMALVFSRATASRSVSPMKRASASQSGSPRKRARDDGREELCAAWYSDGSLGSGVDADGDDSDDDQEHRGRPRKRRRDVLWPTEPVPNLVSGLASTVSPSGAASEPLDVRDASVPAQQPIAKDGGPGLSPTVYTPEPCL